METEEFYPVLDKGFVRLVDSLGDDAAIVRSARVSYGAGTKKVSEDRALIRYLMRNEHWTPFEMCELVLHVKVPMDCWRQWIRHRSASVNEISSRYTEIEFGCQSNTPLDWRIQSKDNKQGSGGLFSVNQGQVFSEQEKEIHESSMRIYHARIEAGMAKEQARKDLPLCTYTEAYWKIDLRNLFNFLNLRMHPHAQQEIRNYATVIGEKIVSKWCPIAWEAFQDYILNSIKLSAIDTQIISNINNSFGKVFKVAEDVGWLPKNYIKERDKTGFILKPNREREEFEKKAIALNIKIPWEIKN